MRGCKVDYSAMLLKYLYKGHKFTYRYVLCTGEYTPTHLVYTYSFQNFNNLINDKLNLVLNICKRKKVFVFWSVRHSVGLYVMERDNTVEEMEETYVPK